VSDLAGWTPIRVDGDEVDWCHTDGILFTEPFFTETIDRCLRHPFRLLFRHRTTFDEVSRFVGEHPGVPLAGFIVHMSRCGSTLVSRMLAAVPEHLMLSEPPPVDAVLRGDGDRVSRLRSIVAALGQPRGRAQRLFVKFDAWSTLELAVVRRAFPDVPWIFVFRDPVDVLASHALQAGPHMIPGVVMPANGVPMPDFGVDVLAEICSAALAHRDDPLATFVGYDALPGFVTGTLLDRWRLEVDDAGRAAMQAAAHRDAKNPALVFEARRRIARPELRRLAGRRLEALYDQLRAAAHAPV